MLKNVYEGLNARPKEYLSQEYFCEMYPTCVSSMLCEFSFRQICEHLAHCDPNMNKNDSPVGHLSGEYLTVTRSSIEDIGTLFHETTVA